MAAKKTNYFTHDSNARNSSKIVKLRMKHGAAGYGVYFMILERLREKDDYAGERDYDMMAFDFRVDGELVRSVVEDFGLFELTDDGRRFYSESFNERMDIKDGVSKKRKEAIAKRWAEKNKTSHDDEAEPDKKEEISEADKLEEKSGELEEKSTENTNVSVEEYKSNTNVSESGYKESKVKESKVKKKIITPHNPPLGGGKRAGARCGEEFLNELLSRVKPQVTERRLQEMNLTMERFRDIALTVLQEWEDFGDRARTVPHLFNHVRSKLRADPSLRNKPPAAARAEWREENARRRQLRQEQDDRLASQLKETGKTSWQLYCERMGLDPSVVSAKDIALGAVPS